MIVKVNGKPQKFAKQSITVAELLTLNKVERPEMVSVQWQGEFLDREAHSTTVVGDQDEVDFLYFMGGGASR